MGRTRTNLSALAIAKLKKPGLHFVGHVTGLALNINKSGGKSWILRTTILGKRCDLGLGPFPITSLVQAKDCAIDKLRLIRDGGNPIARKPMIAEPAIAVTEADQSISPNFEEAAKQYIAAQRAGWKSAKHAAQWPSTLATYAYPVIGKHPVQNIGLDEMLRILEPIWRTKAETANRVRGRVEAILDWCRVKGLRSGDNPARWQGNLAILLPSRHKVAKVKHHKALDWALCPRFITDLRMREGSSIDALLLVIMTACRSSEVRGALWSEIDFDRQVWTIPAARMKADKEHRVPLPLPAVELLMSLRPFATTEFIFPSERGKMLSDMALTMILRRMNVDATVHGFRSTFRDWAGETTNHPREVIEHALAHQLKNKTEAAYARGDQFNKRRELMRDWTEFLFSHAPAKLLITYHPASNGVSNEQVSTHERTTNAKPHTQPSDIARYAVHSAETANSPHSPLLGGDALA